MYRRPGQASRRDIKQHRDIAAAPSLIIKTATNVELSRRCGYPRRLDGHTSPRITCKADEVLLVLIFDMRRREIARRQDAMIAVACAIFYCAARRATCSASQSNIALTNGDD